MSDLPARSLIVLAEDNEDLRGLLAAGLEHVGFRVIQAASGTQLVDTVQSTAEAGSVAVSLIISDLRMPGLGGLEAVRVLRGAGLATPVILITAFGDPEIVKQAESLNCAVLDKPLGITSLRAAVAAVLGDAAFVTTQPSGGST